MHFPPSCLALLLLTITFSPLADSRIFDDALDANSLAQQDLEKVILQTPTNIHRKRPHRPHPNHPPHPHINKKTATGEGDQETEENDVAEEETSPSEEGPSGAITYVIGMLDKAFHFLNLKKIVKNVQNHRSTPGACYACRAAMAMVKFLIEYGRGLSDVAYVTSYFCKSLDVQTPRVCEGYVNNFMEEFVVVMSKVDIDSHEICGTLLGDSCSQVTDPRHNWSLPLPPTVRRRKSLLQRPFSSLFWQQSSFNGGSSNGAKKAAAVSAVKPFKVLQISDIHLDPEYKEGSNAVCGEPLCCRPSSPGSNLAINADRKAGYWGDYRDCDIPLHTVEETFRYIRDNHPDIDYILWTGDIPPHDIWSQTRDSQLELINVVGSLLDQYFGHIPIYPVVGNHETLPMNSFPQPTAQIETKYTKSWLYDKLSESWLRWLPLETQATIEKGAFFAARPKSGLKIISLNTNFCNNQNWWILLNSTDPGDQLQWLIKQLTESEELGEMVQILGHVPPGSSDCIQMWSRNYNNIINRFAHIIKGQFFGHTHNDEFEIFYEDVTPKTDQTFFYDKTYKATNVAYIGPSITTFGNVNPGYRIYTVDPYSFDLLDHETYFLNLTAANGHRNSQSLQFEKSYSAKKAYGLKNLSAAEWHKLVMRMRTPRSSEDRVNGAVQTAEKLFQQFYRYFYNRSDNVGDNRCEDESCKYEILCRLVTALSQDTAICRHFLM